MKFCPTKSSSTAFTQRVEVHERVDVAHRQAAAVLSLQAVPPGWAPRRARARQVQSLSKTERFIASLAGQTLQCESEPDGRGRSS